MLNHRNFLRVILALVILFLISVIVWNFDVVLRTYHAMRDGTFSVLKFRFDVASFDIGRSTSVSPVDVKISAVDGMAQLYVPAGEFTMGDNGSKVDENSPSRKVYLDAFWIDKVEVTNSMYAKCVDAGDCSLPTVRLNPYYGNWVYRDYPVVYTNWFQASDYCAWAGRRLPTEAEWEKAARGTDTRRFPWGNEKPNPRLANYNDSLVGESLPSFRYPLGASPYGALNMVGNVREWVADWYDPDYYRVMPYKNPQGPETGTERSLRSGAYDADANEIYTYSRYKHEPQSAGLSRGFRCAENGDYSG